MPVVRVASVDEVHFLTSLKYDVWGSSTARFKNWQVGDYLLFVVDKAIAGVAEVSGEPFVSQEVLWEGGLYPYRVPLKFVHVMRPEIRPPIYGDVWEAFTSAWGTRYGWGMATQTPLPESAAEIVFEAIYMRPNEVAAICSKIEAHLEAARQRRSEGRVKRVKPSLYLPKPRKSAVARAADDDSAHLKAQSQLIRLGRLTECHVWVARNDRNRVYEGKPLGEDSLKKFPNLGLPKEVADRIALIDVLWIRRDMPVYAFEVEVTSAVYSGLLRMADLVALVPLLSIKLFIAAPHERRDKVLRELARPTFQKIGLSALCRFVAVEDLEILLAKVENLGGHIQPSILDTIAVELDDALKGISIK
jgi:hypothetical protein